MILTKLEFKDKEHLYLRCLVQVGPEHTERDICCDFASDQKIERETMVLLVIVHTESGIIS